MKKQGLFILTSVIMLSLLLVACSSTPTTAPVQQAATPQGVAPIQAVSSAPATKAAPTAPTDVPIMTGAYGIETPTELNITYKVDAPIKDVVAFYESTLPEAGWDQMSNPDSVVGSMAQMSRSKTNGDRITFSLQYNPVGSFTIVQIYLTRSVTP
jgi:hypothetical protein